VIDEKRNEDDDEEEEADEGHEDDDEGDDEDFEDEEVDVPCIEPERAQAFKKTMRQLKTFHKEIRQISGKKPDNPINKFKLGLINETLEKANFVLGNEFLPFPGFKTFDETNMPSASDVVLILSHYIDGLAALRDKYYVDGRWSVSSGEEIDEECDDN
jgi:hypothetical protein